MFSKLTKQYFTFIKGLITEASPLTFPEGASLDEENFELEVTGSRRRRLGLDYEEGYTLATQTVASTDGIATGVWTSVRNDSTKTYVVVQTGATVHFYEDADDLSANKLAFTIDLTDYKVDGVADADVAATSVDMCSGRGAFYMVSEFIEPLQITINDTFSTLSVVPITIFVRDFIGADEDIGNDTEPTVLTDAHQYNLLNQGWSTTWISSYYTTRTKYPKLNQRAWFGVITEPTGGTKDFDPGSLLEAAFGDTRAANGRFIVRAFDTTLPFVITGPKAITTWSYNAGTDVITMSTDSAHGLIAADTFVINNNTYTYTRLSAEDQERSLDGTYVVVSAPSATQITFSKVIPGWTSFIDKDSFLGALTKLSSSIANPTGVVEERRPRSVAFFSGRCWYSGVPQSYLSGTIFFSKILEKDSYAGECYQAADPTSQYFTEIVDTDGGTIKINDAEDIMRMEAFGTSLLVFAKNGVWQITAGDGGYFRPSSYGVRKVTNIGIVGQKALTIASGVPIYASQEGLIALVQDSQTGFIATQNLTEQTIQTLYNSIPKECLPYMSVAYEPMDKKVLILYSNTTTNKLAYDYQLTLDLRLKAFYLYTFPDSNPYVAGIVVRTPPTSQDQKVKYLTVKTNSTAGITFSQFRNTAFKDWYTFDSTGVDAAGYLVTGYELGEAAFVSKYAPVVHVFLNRTETEFTLTGYDFPSSCTMQVRWDWADHANSGKFGQSQEVYRHKRAYAGASGDPFDDGQPVVVSRNKVRGRGKAMHIKFSTTSGKDCQLLGWSVLLERDRRV